jgi:hypothetical protein
MPVDEEYRFETDEGTRSLAELFDGRSQLLVYHFMFGPELRGRLPDVLVERRRRQRRPAASPRPRRNDRLRLAGTARAASGVQAADGMELPLDFLGEQ